MISRRWFGLGLLASGSGIKPALALPGTFDAVVGSVDAPGVRSFPDIQSAYLAAPIEGNRPYRILIGQGLWRERLIIERPNIHLIGTDRASTILSYDLAAGMKGADGKPVGTWGCASIIVKAPGFQASDLTIENSFDYIGHLAAPQFERIGPNGAQAVALMLTAQSDRAHLTRVTLTGHQDTLFIDSGAALFDDCAITGSVDFIFGAGAAWFQKCLILSRFRPGQQRNHGYIAAPATSIDQDIGFIFDRCRLERETQVPDGGVVLGRPWRPTRQFSDGAYGDPKAIGSAYYLDCWMDGHISADGWDEMGYTARDGQRQFLQPSEARFGEFGSAGPGAFSTHRRPRLTQAKAAQLKKSDFTNR